MYISKLSLSVPKEVLDFIVPFLSLFFLAALVATNGIGSTGIILVLAFIAWSEPELRNRWWRVVWPWLLVISIYFVLMSTYAFSKVTALRDGIEVIKGVALSLVALYLLKLTDFQLRRVTETVVIVLSGATLAIVIYNLHQHSIFDFIHNTEFDWYVNRNRLAVGFSVTSIFIAALMVGEESRWKSIFLSICWVLLAITALLNGSRGAVVGMSVATICIIFAALPRLGWRQVFRLELWLLPISIVLAIASWVFCTHISLDSYFVHGNNGIDTGRFEIWKTVSKRISQAPWIGYGPHATKFDPMLAALRSGYGIDHPHSIYVGLVYTSGLVGVLFWLIWFVSFSYKMKRNFTTKNELSYYVGIGLLINILVHGLVDFDLYMYSVFTYITVGLVMMLSKFVYQERA